MDASAIKEIGANAAAVALNGDARNNDVPVAYLPDSFDIHSLDKYQDHKSRYTGAFKSGHIQSFAGYFTTFSVLDNRPDVFINSEAMSAKCYFDLGNPGEPLHGEHTALLTLEKTAAFKSFEKITDRKISQRDAAEWVEDWRELIQAFDQDDHEIDVKKLVSTIRKISIEQRQKADSSEGQYSSSRSAMEEIEAKSGEGELPKVLVFKCEPYHCIPEMEFRFRLAIHTDGAVSFTLHRIKEEEDQERIADQFTEKLTGALPDDISILQGTFTI